MVPSKTSGDIVNKLYFTLFLALPFVLFAQTAKIKIDVDRTIGEIDPKIYGVFMEPIEFSGRRIGAPSTARFNTLYGNLYDPSSPIAQSYNSFLRYADVVKMPNFTMMTSLLSTDREKGSFKSPLFYTFKLFSNNCRGYSIDTHVECDTFNTKKYKGIPFLDVTSVYSKEIKSHTPSLLIHLHK